VAPTAGHPLRAVALAGAAATVVAIALEIIAPIDHGVWLIAYLLLVGAVAPLLLARGERRLGAAAEPAARWQAMAWLAGVAAVPAGVLADVRLLVVAGGGALLGALASIARLSLAPHRGGHRARPGGREAVIQAGVVAFMAVSTIIGIALAWDTPWL